MLFSVTIQTLALLGGATFASAASLQQFTNWGANPGNLPRVDIYVPDRLAARPPVVIGLHPCGGSGSGLHGQQRLSQYADREGFILVYPTSKSQSGMNCWDNHSSASLRRDGGGETESIKNIVNAVLSRYSGDPSKVFVFGTSSGAMMTNNMAALYPDIFNAAMANSGIPARCFTGAVSSNPMSPDQTCANAQKRYSPQQWGDLARQGYPGYSGKRTRMMIVHGTADSLTVFGNYQAQLDQWSNVLGLSATGERPNTPISGWTQKTYGDGTQLVGYAVQGGGHIPFFNEDAVYKFFFQTGTSTPPPPVTATTTRPTSTTTTSVYTPPPPPTSGVPGPIVPTSPEWGQCGGIGWSGPTQCASGLRCVRQNDYYSQCLR